MSETVVKDVCRATQDGDFYCQRFFKEWSVFPLTFWEVIEKMDWKGACESGVKAPYEVSAKRLVEVTNDNPRIIEDINQTFHAYKKILKTTIEDYEVKVSGTRFSQNTIVWHGCDDSFDDFTSHIIGMGKEVFFEVLANPLLANHYTDSYRESFAYSFHRFKN